MSEQVALVTGASRGIGAATARRLARDGMAVAINSHPEERMVAGAEQVAAGIRDDGGTAAVYVADISEAAAVDSMFGRCEEDFGRVGVLVSNAAVTRRAAWTEITEADWDRILAVNLTGAFLCSQRAFADPPGEGGAIVTVSSVLARVGAADSVPYATTKAGLLGFTRSMARALGPAGVRVNSVMPGAIRTEEELEAFPDQAAMEREALTKQALQRRGVADDIANVVGFLAGPDSAFITGQTVCVDGGWVLH
jgi:NAD(P)-dependent dehydrogenase (short-subunit alcohol dehydrogenase family)